MPRERVLLVEGVNVLAVEIHQVSSGSSDISFDLELTAERARAIMAEHVADIQRRVHRSLK